MSNEPSRREPGFPSTWQPIATVPLDGTDVLVHMGFFKHGWHKGRPHIEVMRFHGFVVIPSEASTVAHWRWMHIPE